MCKNNKVLFFVYDKAEDCFEFYVGSQDEYGDMDKDSIEYYCCFPCLSAREDTRVPAPKVFISYEALKNASSMVREGYRFIGELPYYVVASDKKGEGAK